jgi:hypothetical protein
MGCSESVVIDKIFTRMDTKLAYDTEVKNFDDVR